MEHTPKTPTPLAEADRLADLYEFQMLDTPCEEPFDGIAEVAAALFRVPYAAITLIDADRQWFKANIGIPFNSSPRSLSFCAHTIMEAQTMVVEDFTQDPRFEDHPFVVGEPRLRFYAGCPILSERRQCVGTVCLLDVQPRTFSSEQKRLLERIARQATDALEMRKTVRLMADEWLSIR